MRIRPYMESRDYEYVEKWIDSEKIHVLWCAGLIPYPLNRQDFHGLLERNAEEWADSAYVAEEDGTVIGFFCYSVNTDNNEGFLKLVVVDPAKRGMGYGRKMLELALQYAFDITGAEQVQINVFTEQVLFFHGESWGRYNMVIRRQDLDRTRNAERTD